MDNVGSLECASANTWSKGKRALKEYPDGDEFGIFGQEVFNSMAILDEVPGAPSESFSRRVWMDCTMEPRVAGPEAAMLMITGFVLVGCANRIASIQSKYFDRGCGEYPYELRVV
jgi:hypothetical protein